MYLRIRHGNLFDRIAFGYHLVIEMKEGTKGILIGFLLCCIPGAIMVSIITFVPHDPAIGVILALLTFIALTIPIMFVMAIGERKPYP